jgi:hypothetical protein
MSNDPQATSQQPAPSAPAAEEDPFWSNLKGLGYCLFALVGGIVLLGWQWNARGGAAATLEWPTTTGKVVSSEIEEKQVYRRKRLRQVFEPQIQYSYQVDGRDYTASRVDYFEDDDFENEDKAIGVTEKYPVGKEVNVSYDPQDPASAVLEPGITGSNATWSWVMIGLGGFLTLVGIAGSLGSGYGLATAGSSKAA